jgi:hypothetical protein
MTDVQIREVGHKDAITHDPLRMRITSLTQQNLTSPNLT